MPGTPKQDRFMEAIAHGFKPDRVKAPPVSVAKKWTEDVKKKRKVKEWLLTNKESA
jgi:hypothetical protein